MYTALLAVSTVVGEVYGTARKRRLKLGALFHMSSKPFFIVPQLVENYRHHLDDGSPRFHDFLSLLITRTGGAALARARFSNKYNSSSMTTLYVFKIAKSLHCQ